MKNKSPNIYDRTGSSQDFSNNEGYHNYQDYTDQSFKNTPQFSDTRRPPQYGSRESITPNGFESIPTVKIQTAQSSSISTLATKPVQ